MHELIKRNLVILHPTTASMSSHHFVKEGQEPALIIAEPLPFEVVQPLLEWAPLVIVFEHAIDHVLSWGIKTDVILSADIPDDLVQKAAHQQPFELVISKRDGMLDEAIRVAIGKNHRFVTVAVANARTYFEKSKALFKDVDISIIDGQAKWSGIHSGIFTKWFSANGIFYLDNPENLKISGQVEQQDINTYRTQSDSIITVKSNSFFWIGEPLQ